jgi:hypothetical protein
VGPLFDASGLSIGSANIMLEHEVSLDSETAEETMPAQLPPLL